MKVQALFKFLPTPKEYRGRAVLLEVDSETLKSLMRLDLPAGIDIEIKL